MRCSKLLCAALAATSAAASLAADGRATSLKLDGQSKEAIQTVVREYLIANPEVIEQAIQALRAKREAEENDRAKTALASNSNALRSHPMTPVSGNLTGDVTVVEFFDYQCGYCKNSMAALLGVLSSDQNVRVVWKELPILGHGSRFAARAAMAANKQGKYFDYHIALMRTKGRLTEQKVMSLAKNVGLDVKRLRKDMKDPAIEAYLKETHQLATELGIRGTPAFVIGNTLIPGAIDETGIKSIIAEIRAGS